MKFILPLILIALVIWFLLRRRGDDGDDRGPRDPQLPPPDSDAADREDRKEKIDAD